MARRPGAGFDRLGCCVVLVLTMGSKGTPAAHAAGQSIAAGTIVRMKAALETLLKLRDEGLLARFAIGGAIAASYYVEAVVTEDLDVFAFLTPAPSGLLLLGPLYERG